MSFYTTTRLLAAFSLLPATTALGQLLPWLESLGARFDGSGVRVTWETGAGRLPAELEVLKTAPAVFSLDKISNVVALGEFKDPARAAALLAPASRGRAATFEEAESGKVLSLTPATGYIEYIDRRADALPGEPVHGVPDEAEALAAARIVLKRLGIAESDLAHRSETGELYRGWVLREIGGYDKQQHKKYKKTTLRGVILFRQVNGLSLSGPGDCGGVRVEFANEGKIRALAVSWRNLKPHHAAKVADPAKIARWIQQGKAVIRMPDDSYPPGMVKGLSVTKVTPQYLGCNGQEPQSLMYPFAMLRATADLGFTNLVVWVNCPLVE